MVFVALYTLIPAIDHWLPGWVKVCWSPVKQQVHLGLFHSFILSLICGFSFRGNHVANVSWLKSNRWIKWWTSLIWEGSSWKNQQKVTETQVVFIRIRMRIVCLLTHWVVRTADAVKTPQLSSCVSTFLSTSSDKNSVFKLCACLVPFHQTAVLKVTPPSLSVFLSHSNKGKRTFNITDDHVYSKHINNGLVTTAEWMSWLHVLNIFSPKLSILCSTVCNWGIQTVILTDGQRADLFVCVSVCMASQIFNEFYFKCAHYVHEDP